MQQNYWMRLSTTRLRRRQLLAAAGTLAGSIALAGCGGSSNTAGNSNTSGASVSGAATAAVGSGGAAVGSGATAAASSGPAANIKRGGTVTFIKANDPSTLDPRLGFLSIVEYDFLLNIFDTLFRFTPDLMTQPSLAQSSENPDGLTYIYKLIPGVKFHDGTALDAAAVVSDISWAKDPANKALVANLLAPINRLEAVDPQTVKISLSEPFALYNQLFADRSGMISSPTAREKSGKDYGRNPVGSGPFRFDSWTTNDRVVMKRFEGYRRSDLPYLDQLVCRIIPDPQVAVTALKGGEGDLLYGAGTIPQQQFPQVSGDSSIQIDQRPALPVNMLFVNGSTPPFNSQALRLAVAYALDRKALATVQVGPLGRIAQGLLPSFDPAAPKNLAGFPEQPDLEKAKQKLAEGGMPNGFNCTLLHSASALTATVAQAIQQQLAKVGIKMDIESVDATTSTQRLVNNQYQFTLSAWLGRDTSWETMRQVAHSKGGYNNGRHVNPQLDMLIDTAGQTYDEAKRNDLLGQADQLNVNDACDIVLTSADMIVARRKRVQGFVVYGDARGRYETVYLS